MTPQTRRILERHEAIRQAERSRRLARWVEAVARIQGTPARSPDEARAKLLALEQAGYPGP
jgi:hypothetical protein